MAISSRASQAGGRPAPTPPGLPVWNTVGAAFADVLAHSDKVTRLALPWLVLCVAVNVVGLAVPSKLDLALIASQLVSSLGGLAITVAWVRWRMLGETPPAGARPNRHVGRVALRLLWPVAILGVVMAGVLMLFVGLGVALGSKAVMTLGTLLTALAVSVLYLAFYPVLALYGMAGSVGGPGTSLRDIRTLTGGYRGRLWLAYALMLLITFLIPVVGLTVGAGTLSTLGPVLRQPLEGASVAPLTQVAVTSLSQLVSFGMSALFGAFTAAAWTRLKAAKAEPSPVAAT